MQFTKIFAILATAMAANAVPTGGSGDSNVCSIDKPVQACCDSALGINLCTVVSIIGVLTGSTTCTNNVYCCENNGGNAVGTLINVNALNCVKVL